MAATDNVLVIIISGCVAFFELYMFYHIMQAAKRITRYLDNKEREKYYQTQSQLSNSNEIKKDG